MDYNQYTTLAGRRQIIGTLVLLYDLSLRGSEKQFLRQIKKGWRRNVKKNICLN